MILTLINKEDILEAVEKNISMAQKEILTTMLLSEEITNALPKSYYDLLKSKLKKGILLKRLGFGNREDYNIINTRLGFLENYKSRYLIDINKYQRMVIIDKKILFLGVDNNFLKSEYRKLIKVFENYFRTNFEKGIR